MKFSCAAQHLCKGVHLEVGTKTKCKQCKKYMHLFCTGLAVQPSQSYVEAQGGYTCAKCANELVMMFFDSPAGRATQLTNSQQDTPLLPLPVQQTFPSSARTMLGNIPVYHTLGKLDRSIHV